MVKLQGMVKNSPAPRLARFVSTNVDRVVAADELDQ
jgi:hypothetical protein